MKWTHTTNALIKCSHLGKKCEMVFVCFRCKMRIGSKAVLKATVDVAITTHLAIPSESNQLETIFQEKLCLTYQGNPVRSWYESSSEITCRVNISWLAAVAPIISCPKSNPLPRSVGLENSRDWKRPSAIDGAEETWWGGEREEEQEWRERLRWESKTLRYAIPSDWMWICDVIWYHKLWFLFRVVKLFLFLKSVMYN